MEIIIAILWYLQLIFVNTTYTTAEIDAIAVANQPAMNDVQCDEQLMNSVMDSFNEEIELFKENDIVELWREDEPEPIKN